MPVNLSSSTLVRLSYRSICLLQPSPAHRPHPALASLYNQVFPCFPIVLDNLNLDSNDWRCYDGLVLAGTTIIAIIAIAYSSSNAERSTLSFGNRDRSRGRRATAYVGWAGTEAACAAEVLRVATSGGAVNGICRTVDGV